MYFFSTRPWKIIVASLIEHYNTYYQPSFRDRASILPFFSKIWQFSFKYAHAFSEPLDHRWPSTVDRLAVHHQVFRPPRAVAFSLATPTRVGNCVHNYWWRHHNLTLCQHVTHQRAWRQWFVRPQSVDGNKKARYEKLTTRQHRSRDERMFLWSFFFIIVNVLNTLAVYYKTFKLCWFGYWLLRNCCWYMPRHCDTDECWTFHFGTGFYWKDS